MADYGSPNWGTLGEIADVYRRSHKQAEQDMTLKNLGNMFQSGNVDYNQAGGQLIRSGALQEGLALIKMGEEQKAGLEFSKTLGGLGQPPSPVQNPPSAQAPPGAGSSPPVAQASGGAIAGIESGGRYDALGPIIPKSGDRAYGKYQVMGANIPQWTQQVLGRQMTPQEFVASPEAQEAVFRAKFGEYQQKYGPEGAARAWFAGEGGMNDPNRKDILGTTVKGYSDRFMAAGGGGGQPQVMGAGGLARPDRQGVYGSDAVMMPQQTAQADPAALPPNATPTQGFAIPGQPAAGPPRGAVSENPAAGNIAILAAASANPRLPATQRELAKALLTKALDDAKLTDDQKEYWRTYVPQETVAGRTPKDFNEYKISIKRASAITSGETEFEKDMSKVAAKRWGGYMDAAEKAQTKLVDINQMREISRRVGSQGAWAGVKEALGPYAEALGVDVKNLSDIQSYSSIIQRLAPQNRVVGSGSTSDIEFKGMLKAMPGLMQNPAAREMTLDTMEALARYDMAQGEIASRLAAKEITQVGAEKELRALPDPMKNFREWRKANPQAFGQALSAASNPEPPPSAQFTPPKVGDVQKGYRFLGGNPAEQNSWQKVQ